MSPRGPSRLAVIAVTAAAVAVGAGVLALADRTATGGGAGPPGASSPATGASTAEATGESSGAPAGGSSVRASAAAPAGPLAVDQRGCGWFLAYEPGLLALLDRSPAVDDLDPEHRRLLRAAVVGDTDRMRSALAAGAPADVVAPGFPYTPLTVSASSQCSAAVDLLLAAGADPDLRLPGEAPALVVAVLVGDTPSVVALLEAGADPAATGADGTPVRELARVLEREEIGDLLAQAQRSPADVTGPS